MSNNFAVGLTASERNKTLEAAFSGGQEVSNIVRTNGLVTSMKIGGDLFDFTWASGNLTTVVGRGVTKTFTYVSGQLQSVVIS